MVWEARIFLVVLLAVLSSVHVIDGTSLDNTDDREGDYDDFVDKIIPNYQQWACDDLTPDLCHLTVSEGQVPIRDGLYVHFWKYEQRASIPTDENNNEMNSTTSTSEQDPIPVIVIHGGPSFTHNYMLPLKQLACRESNRPVYFYDQTGCGLSTLPSNITNATTDYPFLLDKYYYAHEELPTLIQSWGLTRYHIVANSWGTILSQYFAIDENPQTESTRSRISPRSHGLVSLTLSGPLSDGDLYEQSQWDPNNGNLGSLPPYTQRRIHTLEHNNDYDDPEYKAITDSLTTYFTVRTSPAPDCWDAAENGANMEIYVGMQGPSEFTFGGTLAHFNMTPYLPTLDVPVLLTSGKYDTMRPPVVDTMYRSIPKSEWIMFPHSGHVSMIDDAGLMNDAVDDFLNRVEESHWSQTEFVPKMDSCGPFECTPKEQQDHRHHRVRSKMDVLTANTAIVSRLVVEGSPHPIWIVAMSSFVCGILVSFLVTHGIVRARSRDTEGYQQLT